MVYGRELDPSTGEPVPFLMALRNWGSQIATTINVRTYMSECAAQHISIYNLGNLVSAYNAMPAKCIMNNTL